MASVALEAAAAAMDAAMTAAARHLQAFRAAGPRPPRIVLG